MREADSDDGLDIMLLSASIVVVLDTFVTVEVRRGEVNANDVGYIDAATMATISMNIISLILLLSPYSTPSSTISLCLRVEVREEN